MPEMTLLVFVLYFEIGQGSVTTGTPVDQAVGPVDKTIFIQPNKDFTHSRGEPFVHGKTLAPPITGSSQTFQLLNDLASGLFTPLPDPVDELFATDCMTIKTFGSELSLNHILGCDAGVIGARHPEDLAATHSFPASQDILQRIVKSMPHMQHTGHVRRRNYN